MLNNYLIDILIIMLNIFGSYNKILNSIMNTLYKTTTTSSINLQKLIILKFKLFQSTETFDRENHTFVPRCRKFREVNFDFVIFCEYFD